MSRCCGFKILLAYFTHTHTHTHTHIYTHIHTHTHPHTHICTHTHSHTLTYAHIHTPTHTNTPRHTHPDTHTHTHIYIYIHIHIHKWYPNNSIIASSLHLLPFIQVYTQTPEDVNRYLAAGTKESFAESLAAQQNMKLGKNQVSDTMIIQL